jgi:magnesium transporter
MPETPQTRPGGHSQSAARASFYGLQGRNLSNTSLESESLLDHRLVAMELIQEYS